MFDIVSVRLTRPMEVAVRTRTRSESVVPPERSVCPGVHRFTDSFWDVVMVYLTGPGPTPRFSRHLSFFPVFVDFVIVDVLIVLSVYIGSYRKGRPLELNREKHKDQKQNESP